MAFGDSVYLIGGSNASSSLADVWMSGEGSSWALVNAAAAFGARGGACATMFADKIMLLGGARRINGGITVEYLNDAWTSTDGCEWLAASGAIFWGGLRHLYSTRQLLWCWFGGPAALLLSSLHLRLYLPFAQLDGHC